MRFSHAVLSVVLSATASFPEAKGSRRHDGFVQFRRPSKATSVDIARARASPHGDLSDGNKDPVWPVAKKEMPRPLWETMVVEEESEGENKEDLVQEVEPDVGVLDPKRQRRAQDEAGPRCDPTDPTCDCSMFDASIYSGTFSCSYMSDTEGGYTIYANFTDVDNYTYKVVGVYENVTFDYGYSVVAGEVMDCAVAINGCECVCNLGICPDISPDTGIFSATCPGFSADVNFCGDDLLVVAPQCDAPVLAPAPTLAVDPPTMAPGTKGPTLAPLTEATAPTAPITITVPPTTSASPSFSEAPSPSMEVGTDAPVTMTPVVMESPPTEPPVEPPTDGMPPAPASGSERSMASTCALGVVVVLSSLFFF